MRKLLFLFPIFYLLLAVSIKAAATDLAEDETFKRAIAHLQNGNHGESEAILKSLVRQDPKKALYWFNLGHAHFARREFRSAIGAYEQVVNLKSPLAPIAKLYWARSLKGLGERDRARSFLIVLQREKLPPRTAQAVQIEINSLVEVQAMADVIFARGMQKYKKGKFPQAIELFEESYKSNKSAEPLMMKGLAYLRVAEPERARDALSGVLNHSPRADLAELARSLLTQIKENMWQGPVPYWLRLDTAVGYNSNYFEEAGGGSPQTMGQFSMGGGYHYHLNTSLSLHPQYSFTWQNAFGLAGRDIQAHSLILPLNLQSGSFFFQLSPTIQSQYLGGAWLLLKPGVGVRAQWTLDRISLGLSYAYTNQIAQNSRADYLSGSNQVRRAYVLLTSRLFETTLYYADWLEHIGDELYFGGTIPLANHSYGPGAIVSWYFSPTLQLDTALAFYWKDYLNRSVPQGLSRGDRQTYLAARITYMLTSGVNAYLSSEFFLNQSTFKSASVSDKNFETLVTYAGIGWDVYR